MAPSVIREERFQQTRIIASAIEKLLHVFTYQN